MARRRVEKDLIAAAIQMFGKLTFDGVTTRGLAAEAGCEEGGLYRVFTNKEGLYAHVIGRVVKESVDRMAEFALEVYTAGDKDNTPAEILKGAVHRWYWSMTIEGAKLLQQVFLNDKDHRKEAQRALDSVVAILQTTLGPVAQASASPFDAKTRSEALIWALFQFKTSYAGPTSQEKHAVDRYLTDWLLSVGLGEKSVRVV
jgi:AcrR family transcriptional regulator